MAFRATSLLKAAQSVRSAFRPRPITRLSNSSPNTKPMASTTPPTTTRQSPLDMQLTFLGTASAMPSSTRAHSSLALRVGGDVWLFDCGEGTQSRIQQSIVKMGRIEKIFITHTHGDHIFGLLPLMAGILNGAGGERIDVNNPVIEIYGPLGTRAYIRAGLRYTHTFFNNPFIVHELRLPSDPKTDNHTPLPRHNAESPHGRNIQQVDGRHFRLRAPILHSVPCVGYVINEAPVPGKMDPKKYIPELKRTNTHISAMARLQKGESVELSDGTVLHGPPRRRGRKLATNAHLPMIDPNTKLEDTHQSIQARTRSRGHSTPQMAGAFAKRIRAKRLFLNHFSPRYPGNDDVDPAAKTIMGAIGALAEQEFGDKFSSEFGGSDNSLLASLASPSSNSSSLFFLPLKFFSGSSTSPISISSSTAASAGTADSSAVSSSPSSIFSGDVSPSAAAVAVSPAPSGPGVSRGDWSVEPLSRSLPMNLSASKLPTILSISAFCPWIKRFCVSCSARIAAMSFSRDSIVLYH
ncbi:beta-lactamase-like protein [Mycena galopus ATCC 62051]|nr:beta-lactamase-like protein [Mycena galopus ATCC 62051]